MNDTHAHEIILVLCLCLSILIIFGLFIWGILREVAVRCIIQDSVKSLADVSKQLEALGRQIDQEGQVDGIKQQELRQMLKISETRMLDAINRLSNASTGHVYVDTRNSNSNVRDVQGDGHFGDGDQLRGN